MLDPDQAGHLVGPDLDPNCLHYVWFKLSMSHKKDREQYISFRFHTSIFVWIFFVYELHSIKNSSQNSILAVGVN